MSFKRSVEADEQDSVSRHRAIIEKKRKYGNKFVCPNCFAVDDYESANSLGQFGTFWFESEVPEQDLLDIKARANLTYLRAKYFYINSASRCNNCKNISTAVISLHCRHEIEGLVCVNLSKCEGGHYYVKSKEDLRCMSIKNDKRCKNNCLFNYCDNNLVSCNYG